MMTPPQDLASRVLMLTLVCSPQITHSALAPTVSLGISAPRTYLGLPAAFQGENFTVTIRVRLEQEASFHPLTATLSLPGTSSNTQSCKNHVSGSQIACSGSAISFDSHSIVNMASSAVNFGSKIIKSDPSYIGAYAYTDSSEQAILINFGTIRTAIDGVAQDSPDEVQYSVTMKIEEEHHGISTYNFSVEVVNGDTGSRSIVMKEAALAFKGPDLVVEGSASASNVESGSTIGYTYTVMHDQAVSTESANNVQISFAGFSGTSLSGTGSWTKNGSPQGTLTASQLSSQFSLSTVATTDVITITFNRVATDAVPVGDYVDSTVTLTYTISPGTGTRTFEYHVPIRAIVWTSEPLNPSLVVPSNVSPGEIITKDFSFLMPLGTISEFSLQMSFESEVLHSIPVSFKSSTIDAPAYIQFATPSLKSITSSGFTVATSRRKRHAGREKRAVISTLTVTRPLSDLTNPAAGGSSMTPVTMQVTFQIGSVSPFPGGSVTSTFNVNYNGATSSFAYSIGAITMPQLTISKTVQIEDKTVYPSVVRFNITVEHTSTSLSDAHRVKLTDGSSLMDIIFGSSTPNFPNQEITVVGDRIIEWNKSQLDFATKETMFLSYKAQPTNKGEDLPDGKTYFNASATYYTSANASDSYKQGPIVATVCIEKNKIEKTNLFYNHGFTFLMFLVGLLVAAVLVVVGVIIFIFVIKRSPRFKSRTQSEKQPLTKRKSAASFDDAEVEKASRGLLGNTSAAIKKGAKTIKDLSNSAMQSSILYILSLRDKLQMHREIDNQDIMSTIDIDTDIENERNNATIRATKLLIMSLRNKPLAKSVEEKCISKFDKNLKDSEKKMDEDYRKELQTILDLLNVKHKEKLVDIMMKQEQEKEDLEEKLKNRSPKEQEEVLGLQNQQHEMELTELSHQLRLERDEAMEKLRKEYAIRKRMAIKEQQQMLLDDVKEEGKLTAEQADWLMKQHLDNQAALEKLYDDEISRQRMNLEEKLAKRRALAKASDTQEKMHSEMLNTLAEQHFDVIDKMKQVGSLSKSEAKEMIRQAQVEMIEAKEKMEQQRERMERDLQKKLADRKKARMQEQAKKHQQELTELEKKHQSQQTDDMALDPLSAVQSRQQLLSHQRGEASRLEDEIDQEQAGELEELRDTVAEETRKQLEANKQKLLDNTSDHGLSEKQVSKLMRQHAQEMENLRELREHEKQKQNDALKAQLEKKRREWDRRKEIEQMEQQALRDHEDQVVRKMMDTQVALSDEERDRILQEHEKQMVKLENSLTLNKLQQKRMLEEKLAHKRAQRMEKLQKTQLKESRKLDKSLREDDDYEGDLVKKEMKQLKRHQQERLDTQQDPDIKIEEEMEEIRNEMLKERATALKEQEVRLGAMLASLQMQKAKELAKIEEQQKAINNLKTNLIDDLNEKGILSNPDCQRVIEIHQQEQEKLSRKLQSQREKQEQTLRERMRAKMANREQALARLQEQQIEETMSKAASSTATRIRMAALKHKHQQELEQFRQRIDKEISQTLEEMKRQNEMRRMHALQEQEMQFLNGLVRLGQFSQEELTNVLVLLYPNKPEEERQQIMQQLCQGYQFPKEDLDKKDQDGDRPEKPNTLETRIRRATLSKIKDTNDQLSLSGSFRGPKSSLKKRKGPRQPRLIHNNSYEDSYASNPAIGYRHISDYAETNSGRASVTFDETDYYAANDLNGSYSRMPPTRLPPVEPQPRYNTGKKKSVRVANYNYSSD